MKKITPTPLGYMLGHYLVVIPLSLIFVLAGIYLFSIEFMGQVGLGAIGAGLVIFFIPLIYSILYSKTTSISFEEDRIVYETGILSRKTKKAPVHMITDSSLTRTLLQRIVGSATLNISTSGTVGYEIVCEGLKSREAKELHDLIYERINQIQKK